MWIGAKRPDPTSVAKNTLNASHTHVIGKNQAPAIAFQNTVCCVTYARWRMLREAFQQIVGKSAVQIRNDQIASEPCQAKYERTAAAVVNARATLRGRGGAFMAWYTAVKISKPTSVGGH
jgi:hypothetical protein